MTRKEYRAAVGTLVHNVAHPLRLRIDEALRPHGLTRVGWLAIDIIEQNDRLTQSNLAARLALGTAATGKPVDRLDSQRLARRHAAPGHRRAHLLAATAKARDLLDRLQPVAEALGRAVLRGLGKTGRDQLQNTLQKAKTRLTESRVQSA